MEHEPFEVVDDEDDESRDVTPLEYIWGDDDDEDEDEDEDEGPDEFWNGWLRG